MKLGIDMDDVVVDFVPHFLQKYNRTHRTNYKSKDLKEYELSNTLHLPREDIQAEILRMQLGGDYAELPEVPFSVASIDWLNREGHEIYFVTNRVCARDTLKWLDDHKVKYDDVILSGKKIPIFKELGIDLVVEDNAETAINSADEGIDTLLFNRPWNEKYHLRDNMVRVYNWVNILNEVRKYGELPRTL